MQKPICRGRYGDDAEVGSVGAITLIRANSLGRADRHGTVRGRVSSSSLGVKEPLDRAPRTVDWRALRGPHQPAGDFQAVGRVPDRRGDHSIILGQCCQAQLVDRFDQRDQVGRRREVQHDKLWHRCREDRYDRSIVTTSTESGTSPVLSLKPPIRAACDADLRVGECARGF